VCLGYSLSKYSRVLSIKKQVDSGQLCILVKTIPVTGKDFSLAVICMNQDWCPLSTAILLFVKTLSGDWREVTFSIKAELDPFFWKAAVIFGIIEGL